MKTKTKIIKSFLDNREPATIKDISRRISADYRITHTATQQLLQQNILSIRKVGNNSLCSLNKNHYCSQIYHAEEERKQALLQNHNIKQLYNDIMKKIGLSHFTFLMTHDKPGFNLLFISNEPHFKRSVEEIISLIPLKIDFQVQTEEEFKQHPKPQKTTILHGIESYYLLVRGYN